MSWIELTWLSLLTIALIIVSYRVGDKADWFAFWRWEHAHAKVEKRLTWLELKYPEVMKVKPWHYAKGYPSRRPLLDEKPDGFYIQRNSAGEVTYSKIFLTREEAEAVMARPRHTEWLTEIQKEF